MYVSFDWTLKSAQTWRPKSEARAFLKITGRPHHTTTHNPRRAVCEGGPCHGYGVFILLLLPPLPVELPAIPRAMSHPVHWLPAIAEGHARPVLRRRPTTASSSSEDDEDDGGGEGTTRRRRTDHDVVVVDRDRQRRRRLVAADDDGDEDDEIVIPPPSVRGHTGEHIRQLPHIQSRQHPGGTTPRFVIRGNDHPGIAYDDERTSSTPRS